jgi:hypothetical protein
MVRDHRYFHHWRVLFETMWDQIKNFQIPSRCQTFKRASRGKSFHDCIAGGFGSRLRTSYIKDRFSLDLAKQG